MSGFASRENAKFQRDADFLLDHSEWIRELVDQLRALSGRSRDRRRAYYQVADFISDFDRKPQKPLEDGHLHLTTMFKGLKAGLTDWPLRPLLAWFCYYHPEEAAIFYEASGLYAANKVKPRRYVGTPGAFGKNATLQPGGSPVEQPSQITLLQPHLSGPPRSANPLHFTNCNVELRGRSEESSQLFAFSQSEPSFLWLQVAGTAGQGKSRLALDMIGRLEAKWAKGFISSQGLDSFDWMAWRPFCPHLIIIDGMLGREASVGKCLKSLALQSDAYEHPVRVILLERQPWNIGNPKAVSSRRSQADWFAKMNSVEGDDLAHESLHFEDGIVELLGLPVECCLEISVEFAESEGRLEQISDVDLAARLVDMGVEGRPLYVLIASRQLIDPSVEFFRRMGATLMAPDTRLRDVLTTIMVEDRRARWSIHFGGEPPHITDNHPALKLAILATMLGEINLADSAALNLNFSFTDRDFRQALAILDRPVDGDGFGSDRVLRELEPHLLGEWFVLSAVDRNGASANLIDLAWDIAPGRMADFVRRCASDFPHERSLLRLLQSDASRSDAIDALAEHVSGLHNKLPQSLSSDPPVVIAALHRAVEADDDVAMCWLASCYELGRGVEKDMEKAFSLYHQALDLGNDEARRSLWDMGQSR